MKEHSAFKYVFISLFVLLLLAFAAAGLTFTVSKTSLSEMPWPMWLLVALPLLFILLVIPFIGVQVYRDAQKRGLDPWLWATVAAFVPYFIGLIIYLVLRQSVRRTCSKCGRGLQAAFSHCPYCGQPVSLKCSQCGGSISADWKVCPHCAAPLNGQ